MKLCIYRLAVELPGIPTTYLVDKAADLLMGNSKIFLALPALINNTIHTATDGIRLRDLMQ